jgi:uncharacterized protein YegP (UPF0339 family)
MKTTLANVEWKIMDNPVEVYRDKAKQYRWRCKAANGEIVADSGEGNGYTTKRACVNGLKLTASLLVRAMADHL